MPSFVAKRYADLLGVRLDDLLHRDEPTVSPQSPRKDVTPLIGREVRGYRIDSDLGKRGTRSSRARYLSLRCLVCDGERVARLHHVVKGYLDECLHCGAGGNPETVALRLARQARRAEAESADAGR
jgi:hypothetical protein